MADGHLNFDTEIDSTGFKEGIASLESAIKDLKSTIKTLSADIKSTFSGAEIKNTTSDVEKQTEAVEKHEGVIDKAGQALEKAFDDSLGKRIVEETKDMAEATGIAGSFANAVNKLKDVAAGATSVMARMFTVKDSGSSKPIDVIPDNEADQVETVSSRMMKLLQQQEALKVKEEQIRAEMEKVANMQIPTDEYAQAETEAKKLESQLLKLYDRQEKFLETGGNKDSSTDKRMAYDIDAVTRKLEYAEAEMTRLNESGRAFKLGSESSEFNALSEKFQKAQSDSQILEQKISELKAKEDVAAEGGSSIGSSLSGAAQKGKAVAGVLTSTMGKLGKTIGSVVVKAGKMGLKLFSALNPIPKMTSAITGKFGGFIKRIGSLAKRVFVFTVITKALRAMKSAISDLISNDSQMKSSLSQIKGNLLTAFAPIYNFILPAIKALMSGLVMATNYMANVVSRIFGKTIAESQALAKQINKQTSATKSNSKATKDANKQLSNYDELQVMSQNDNSSNDNVITPSFNASEVAIDWVDKIKNMIKSGDWEGIGKLVSDKLADALESIEWGKIKKKVKNVVSILSRTLNGFFSNMRLAFDIGETLAEALNTGMLAAYIFLTTFDFSQFGQFLGTAINGAISTFDWALMGETLGAGIQGAIDMLYGFIKTYQWGSLASGLADSVNKLFMSIDWKKAGAVVGDSVKGIFNEISTFLVKVDWKGIGKDIADFLAGIDWKGVAESVFEALGAALGATVALIWGAIEGVVKDIRDYFQKKFKEAGGNIVLGLWNGIKEAIGNAFDWIKKHIFQPFIDGFKKAFGIHSPSTVMKEMGKYIMEGLKNGLVSMKDKVLDVFRGIRDGIKGIINGIIGFINKMISSVLGGINSVIGMLNKLHIDLPDVLGGGSVGFSIEKIPVENYQIPKLAKGAVIPPRAPFMAMLGDQKHGTNIEAPLDTIRQALKEELASLDLMGNVQVDVDIHLDGDADGLFRVTQVKATQYKKRTGKPAFT